MHHPEQLYLLHVNHKYENYYHGLSFCLMLLMCSCKKEDAPAPVAPKLDTLTTGWSKIIVDPTQNFTDIFFNHTNGTGYLTGSKTYKSIDGGVNWNKVSDLGFINLSVTDNETVFLVGKNDLLFSSSDGGNTFASFEATTNGFVIDVFFVDNNNGFYNTSSGLFSTNDGGVNWKKVNLTGFSSINTVDFSSMFFANSNTGYIIVNDSSIYKTNGSIEDWVPAAFTDTRPKHLAVVFATPNHTVFASNLESELYKSTDGGVTFARINIFPQRVGGFLDIHFVDDNNGYVSIRNKIYKTTDAGSSWNAVATLGADAEFSEIHFTDAHHGWACGTDGIVLVYNN